MVEYGKKIYPKKKSAEVEKTATSVKGPYWSIMLKQGVYVFELISGSHGGGVKRRDITDDDFRAVHSGKMTEYELALKYDMG